MTFPSYWQQFPGIIDKEIFHSRIVKASDGYPLVVYEAGNRDNDNAVIVNPPTIPFVLMAKLAASLSHHLHILSWETRGGPYLDEKNDRVSLCLDRHAGDLAEILQCSRVNGVHYIGWCGAAWIICWAIVKLKLPVKSISLIAPNNLDGGKEQTTYQQVVTPIVKRLRNAEPREVESIYNVIREVIWGGPNVDPNAAPAQQFLEKIAALNLETPGAIRQWARAIRDFTIVSEAIHEPIAGETATRLFEELGKCAPLLIMHCRDDDIVSYKCSLSASERNVRAKLVLYPSGGHAVAYLNESAISDDIYSFIRSKETLI